MKDLLSTLDAWLGAKLSDEPLGLALAAGGAIVLLMLRARHWQRR